MQKDYQYIFKKFSSDYQKILDFMTQDIDFKVLCTDLEDANNTFHQWTKNKPDCKEIIKEYRILIGELEQDIEEYLKSND